MTLDATGRGAVTRGLGKMLDKPSRAKADDYWLDATKHEQTTGSAFVILSSRGGDDERVAQLRVGMAYQRMHLWVTANGLAMQPLNQLTERRDREESEGLSPRFSGVLEELTLAESRGTLRFMEAPPICYAATARGQVAYQQFGKGPTLALVPPLAQHIEMMWEQPAFWRPLQRLASGFRVVIFDKLGTGLSDPAPERSTLDDRLEELRAVLDAAGVERGWLLGLSEGGIIAAAAAAGSLAERVEGLLLLSTYSGNGAIGRASAYGSVPERAAYRAFFDRVVAGWGSDETVILSDFAPSLRSIPSMARWIPRYERAAASPAMIGRLMKSSSGLDATDLLPLVKQRTLVIHLSGDRVVPTSFGKMLAALIPGARYVQFEGDDHFSWVSPHVDEIIDLFFAFVGVHGEGQRVKTVWDPWSALTLSERRVVGLAQRGLTNGEIAASLRVSPRTVENHLTRAYSKLGVRSRTELALLSSR